MKVVNEKLDDERVSVIDDAENDDAEEEKEEEEASDKNDEDSGELNDDDGLEDFVDDDFESGDDFLIHLEEVSTTPEQEFEEANGLQSATVCTGFKVVGDNIDKNIRRSYQRIDRTTRSLHYFHMFAVKDRVDFSHLSNSRPTHVEVDIQVLLPSAKDFAAIKNDFEILISR